MAKLHELLAAEKGRNEAWNALRDETTAKFAKDHFFQGQIKTLKMIEDTPANQALEASAREDKAMQTTVWATLDYAFKLFAQAEDIQLQKNLTNATAKADLMFEGRVLASGLPIDELLGLESRLAKIRTMILAMPTLDASKHWSWDPQNNCWVAPEEHTTKTDKKTYPVVLYEATEKHPANVKEAVKDEVVGKFTLLRRSGCATAVQKSDMILVIDELIAECKKARQRANNVDVVPGTIGMTLVNLIMAPLLKKE